MRNIHGDFTLNTDQLERFKKDFDQLSTVYNAPSSSGGLTIILTFSDFKTIVLRGSLEGKYLEVSSKIATLNTHELHDLEWLILDTSAVNFNNYKPR